MGTAKTNLSAKPLLEILGLAAAYFVTGKLGTLLALPPGYATPIWAPSGIALAGLLLLGHGAWPGVFLGSFLINLPTTLHSFDSTLLLKSLLVTSSIGMGASLEALTGAFLIRRYIGFPNPFEDERQVARFLVLGGPVSCVVNATIGVGTLWIAGVIPSSIVPLHWGTWWIGDSIGVIVLTPLILVALAGPEKIWSRRQLSIIMPLGVTFFLVIMLFVFSNSREQAQAKIEFQRKAATLSRALQLKLENYLVVVQAAGNFLKASPIVDQNLFHDFVLGFLNQYPEIQALIWAPRVNGAERAAFIQDMRHSGYPGFNLKEFGLDGEITAAKPRREYVVASFVEPNPQNQNILGLDFMSNPVCRQTVLNSLNAGNLATTDPIGFPHDPADPASLLIFLPVYQNEFPHRTPLQRRQNLRGFVTGISRMDEILASAFKGLNQEGIDLRIFDETPSDKPRLLYTKQLTEQETTSPARNAKNPLLSVGMEWRAPFRLGGRTWSLRFSESQEYIIAHNSWHAWLVLLSGMAFTGSLGAFLLVGTRRTAKIETLVAQRTASLEASESRFRSVMESAQDAIIICDQDGKIISWNRAASTRFGYPESEITGKPLSLVLPALDSEVKPGALPDLTGKIIELEGVRNDGSRVQLELSMAHWRNGGQNFFSAFLRDITERKMIDQMKTDFVSFASHQLKTPLAEIHGFVENMLSGIAGLFNEKQREYLGMIKGASTNSLRLVSDLLSVSKMEQGMISMDLKVVELEKIIRQATEDYRERLKKKDLQLIVESPAKNIRVLADFGKAVEAIKNVLDNAVKFTEQGSITVTTKSRDGLGIVEITDTGKGMDESILNRLFTKEFLLQDNTNVKDRGSGLGLYIAKSFMNLQGGDVTAESLPAKGSKFTFTFRKADRA